MTTLGAVYLPQVPPDRLKAVVRAADESGLDQLWLWEDCFLYSGIAAASAALGWSERLRIGLGLLPVPLRNVALTAMELATIEQLFPGRLLPGVGHGVQDWMGQVGARVASPMTLLAEHVHALRELLHGQTVTTAGRYVTLDNVTLDWPPASAPPIYVGAVKPRTLELAGTLADGTVLTSGSTPADVRAARTVIDAARAAAGRTDRHEVVVYLIAATGTDAAARLAGELARWKLGSVDDLGVSGNATAIAEGISRWVEAGADSVILQPTLDDPDPEQFVRFVGEQVQPLVV